nr:succinic semialdehyde dehydrogenase [Natronomonas pharaonis]
MSSTGAGNVSEVAVSLEALEPLVTAPETDATFPVEAPFTGDEIGRLPACVSADVEAAFDRAAEAQTDWRDRDVSDRAAVFIRYHDRIIDNREELLDLIQYETGKARRHAYEELLDVAITARYYAYRAESFLETEPRAGALPGMTETTVNYRPVGTVGIISPWNYPLSLSVSDAIPALLAGNAVVLKPDEQTSYTALKAFELLLEAGLPDDLVQIVTGDGPTIGEPLVANADYVCFTGSTETGRAVASQAGRHLTDCSLELGGKNPAIVRADADIDRAAEGLVRGCFTNAGQLCLSIERLYVHEAIYDRFLDAFVAAVESMPLGTDYSYDIEMGSLISGSHLEAVEQYVEDAVAGGATVLTGGSPRPDIGPYFYEPTVLEDVDESMALCAEETFGPVVAVSAYSDDADAIERANDTDYGLNAAVWTDDLDAGRQLAERIDAGTVNVNESYAAAWASLDAPMGGMKDSGVGRRHGEVGLSRYTEAQTVAVQKHLGMTAPPGVPYWLYAGVMSRLLKLQRRVPGLR